MRLLSKVLFIAIVVSLSVKEYAKATHIRAAEITSRRVSNTSLQYEFTLTGFTDTGSPVRFGDGIINFGDGFEVHNLTIISIIKVSGDTK